MKMITFRRLEESEVPIYNQGVEDVMHIRCMEHREVPRFNESANGAECAACEVGRWALAVGRMLASLGDAHPLEASCPDCFDELRGLLAELPQEGER